MTTRLCPLCSTAVPDDEPMLRARVGRRRGHYRSLDWEPVCTDCARGLKRTSDDGRVTAFYNESALGKVDPAPCASCGLPVVVPADKRRKVFTCSDRCRSAYYTEKARSVAEPVTLGCAGCGQPMVGRADRRYCSATCRQRAYRRRARLVQLGQSRDDAARIDRLAELSSEQFEEVLRQARRNDDVSAEGVDRLAQEVLQQA